MANGIRTGDPVDSIKDVVRSSVKVPEFDKHVKKAGRYIDRNVVKMTINMKTIVRKPLMIKIIHLRQLIDTTQNFDQRFNAFSFLVNGIFQNEKKKHWTLIIKFWVDPIHILNIGNHFGQELVKLLQLHYEIISIFWNTSYIYIYIYIFARVINQVKKIENFKISYFSR